MRKKHFYIIILVSVFLIRCKEPYTPPFSSESQSFLVVDGFINSTDSLVQVKLSRAVPLSSVLNPPPESGANVSVEDEFGGSLVLAESPAGTYSLKRNFPVDRKYKLHIQTSDLKKYSSDFITIQQSPPIDSLTWTPSPSGVSLMVNSHDPTGNAKYFRWTYDETWQYSAQYQSNFIYDKTLDSVVFRTPDESIYICWVTLHSNQIQLYTTTKLQSDEVNHHQLIYLPKGSPKLSRKYSVLVKQQVLSEEAYNFWYQLQTTTENLGGLFDPLPSQVNGNVQCETDPSQIVLGFFGGSSVTSKRIFISFYDLPEYLRVYPIYGGCELDTIPLIMVHQLDPSVKNSVIWVDSYGHMTLEGYLTTSAQCADCRINGGTTTPPPFWQ